jgi:hypothetical protein
MYRVRLSVQRWFQFPLVKHLIENWRHSYFPRHLCRIKFSILDVLSPWWSCIWIPTTDPLCSSMRWCRCMSTSIANIICIAQITFKFVNNTLMIHKGRLQFLYLDIIMNLSACAHRSYSFPYQRSKTCELFSHNIGWFFIFKRQDKTHHVFLLFRWCSLHLLLENDARSIETSL